MRARAACVDVLAFLIECHVHADIARSHSQSAKLQCTDLWGASGRRRVHNATLSRMQMVQALVENHGSGEAIARALSGGVCSIAAAHTAVRNAVYAELSGLAFTGSHRVAFHWDGSHHGGNDVIIGVALNIDTGRAVYVKPAVIPWLHCNLLKDEAGTVPAPGRARFFGIPRFWQHHHLRRKAGWCKHAVAEKSAAAFSRLEKSFSWRFGALFFQKIFFRIEKSFPS